MMFRPFSGIPRRGKTAYVFCAGLLVVLGVRFSPAQEWHPARGLREAPGVERVRVRVEWTSRDTLSLTYAVPEPELVPLPRVIANRRQQQLQLGSAPLSDGTGQPRLPVIPCRVLLPSGCAVADVEITAGRRTLLPGDHLVEHGQQPYPLVPGVRPRWTPPDPAVYESDAPFPGRLFDIVGVQRQRGAAVLLVNLHPVEYRPRSGQVFYYEELSVRVRTAPEDAADAVPYRPDALRSLAAGVENPATLDTYAAAPGGSPPVPPGLCGPGTNHQYVIVTSQAFRDAATDPALTNLVAHRRAKGVSATIVTIEDIYANYAGVDNAEKLRNFIIDAYIHWATDFVLLGGDTNVIPMRKLWCQAYPGMADEIPSDVYYQCLDGNYNSDGDGLWGEPTDGPGGADVDLLAEVYIGRASAESATEMANFVYKTLAYENESEMAPYLRTALMCGEHLGFGGVSEYAKASMEEIRLGSSTNGYTTAGFAESALFGVDTLYEADTTWAKAAIIGRINSNQYSIINHLGHANYNYVMKFYNSDADALTNTCFLFAYSQGCIPGNFEVDCVAEHLTTSTRHGMFAVVFNARYGWGKYYSTDGPSQRFDRQFWDAYFGELIVPIGGLNADSHEDNLWDINGNCIRWCFYESNLLGDPLTPMRGQFISDAIILSPGAGFASRGGVGGAFLPSNKTYALFSTATNISMAWAASSTQSWVTLSATNGTLAPDEHTNLTVSINANAALLPEGLYFDTVAFTNLTNNRGTTSRTVRLFVNNPPRVTNVSVQAGEVLPAGHASVTVQFSDAIAAGGVSTNDFTLHGAIYGDLAPTSWVFSAGNRAFTAHYGSLRDDAYTLTLYSGDGRFEDADDMDLDGETPSWPIPPNRSGDSVEGGDFVVHFQADAVDYPFPTPLEVKAPRGALVFDPPLSAYITPSVDTDRYTLAVGTNETLSIVVEPDAGLRPAVALHGPGGVPLTSAAAAAPGDDVVMQTVPATVPGTYAVSVSGVGSSTGLYTLRVVLNAAVESELHGAVSNDTLDAAQDIDGSFVSIPGGAWRGAAVGRAEQGPLTNMFVADFTSGLNGFSLSNTFGSGNGLWHRSSGRGANPGHSASWSVYYGHNEGPSGGGDYDTGSANGGATLSPVIALPDSDYIRLGFNFFLETEDSAWWDIGEVQVDDGSGFQTLLSSSSGGLPTGTDGSWSNITADLAAYRGSDVQLRFTFETYDSILNGYEGWYVDDVIISTYDKGAPDYYAFTLASNEAAALAAAGWEDRSVALRLYDAGTNLLATGTGGAAGVACCIRNFVAPSNGTYYACVQGWGAEYSLVVTRGADFDAEPNNATGQAQDINALPLVLGAAGALEPTDPDDVDGFLFDAVAGDTLVFRTYTPGFTTNEFVNELDPVLDLYTPQDVLVATDDNGAGDGRNALLTNLAVKTGPYRVVVRAAATGGEYVLAAAKTAGPPLVTFGSNTAFVAEDALSITLPVLLTSPTSVAVSVDYDAAGGTAAGGGADYTLAGGTLVFAPGQTATSIVVQIHDDPTPEGTETILLRLYNTVNAVLGEFPSNVCVIVDDELPLTVRFAAPGFGAAEESGLATVTVARAGGMDGLVTVDCSTTPGTATPGEDYTPVTGTIVLADGVGSNTFTVPLKFDMILEGDETVDLHLANATGGAALGGPSNAALTILDMVFSQSNRLSNPGFETPAGTDDFDDTDWSAYGDMYRTDWAAHSGNKGVYFEGWTEDGLGYLYRYLNVTRGTYTFTLWVRRERGFNPWILFLWMTWYDSGYSAIGEDVELNLIDLPGDDAWHQVYLTGTCTSEALAHVSIDFMGAWNAKTADPSAFMFDDACFYAGTYLGITNLSNPSFEEGLSGANNWRGSSWFALPENVANARESWGGHTGPWVGGLYGWDGTSSRYATVVAQHLTPGTGTYSFAAWMLRETNFLLQSAGLRLECYDLTYTNKVQADRTTNFVVPNDEAWHQYFLTGACGNTNVFEVRATIFANYYLNTTGLPWRGMKIDDARFMKHGADTDGDGMPDGWEAKYYNWPTNAMPGADDDGDDQDNLNECGADTDPFDPGSCFEITAVSNQGARWITFPCSTARVYDIRYSTNLLSGTWYLLQTNVAGSSGSLSINDPEADTRRFYDIRVRRP